MGLFKADYFRFFTIGFAAGALIVAAMQSEHFGSDLANGVVPPAEAAPAQ
ncbi:MAG: hypothetical protein KDE55_19955 [Novosphingobium sp.]|nr:hypothetical protein [Novosphingobium sp.]